MAFRQLGTYKAVHAASSRYKPRRVLDLGRADRVQFCPHCTTIPTFPAFTSLPIHPARTQLTARPIVAQRALALAARPVAFQAAQIVARRAYSAGVAPPPVGRPEAGPQPTPKVSHTLHSRLGDNPVNSLANRTCLTRRRSPVSVVHSPSSPALRFSRPLVVSVHSSTVSCCYPRCGQNLRPGLSVRFHPTASKSAKSGC